MKSSKVNNCSWFDSENARLIILCATLGVFGAHKFAQHKNFQGVIYILLDLTVVGIILTVILSWLDLIFLTAKSDNRPGNMMLGAVFILLESFVFIPGSSSIVIKKVNPLLTDSNDSLVSVETQNEDVTEISEEMEPLSVEEVVVSDASVNMQNEIMPDNSEMVMIIDAEQNIQPVVQTIVEENVEEPVKVEPVVQKAPVKPKPQPKKMNETNLSADEEQHSEDSDFEHFSLYDMVTGK